MPELSDLAAIRRFFGYRQDPELKNLKAFKAEFDELTPEDKKELGALCREALS